MSADKLVTLHITYFNTVDGDEYEGKREVFHASCIPIGKAMDIEAELDEAHDAGRVRLIEVHRQYVPKQPVV